MLRLGAGPWVPRPEGPQTRGSLDLGVHLQNSQDDYNFTLDFIYDYFSVNRGLKDTMGPSTGGLTQTILYLLEGNK